MGRRDQYFCDWCLKTLPNRGLLQTEVKRNGYSFYIERRITGDTPLQTLQLCWVCARDFQDFLGGIMADEEEDEVDKLIVEKMGGPGGE